MSDTNHLLSAHGSIRINRQRQRDYPDSYYCWRRHENRLLTNPEEVLIYAADMLDSRQLVDLRQWLGVEYSNQGRRFHRRPVSTNGGRIARSLLWPRLHPVVPARVVDLRGARAHNSGTRRHPPSHVSLDVLPERHIEWLHQTRWW